MKLVGLLSAKWLIVFESQLQERNKQVTNNNATIIIIIFFFNPRKNEGGKKIKKSRKRFEVEN